MDQGSAQQQTPAVDLAMVLDGQAGGHALAIVGEREHAPLVGRGRAIGGIEIVAAEQRPPLVDRHAVRPLHEPVFVEPLGGGGPRPSSARRKAVATSGAFSGAA
ncbi:MAG: hypothetical protein L0210_05730 [Rhodospirillales bacterium]|nr:hypothetical protein [Rhodospirillales bacterium]